MSMEKMKMEMHEVCESLVQETEGVQACVILDVETSLTLSQSRRNGVGTSTIRQATRAAGEVFRAKLLQQYVRTLPSPRPVAGFVREAQMSTAYAHLFMSSVPGLDNGVLVCVTEKSVSIGFGWMAVHQAIERLAVMPGDAIAPLNDPVPNADRRQGRPQSEAGTTVGDTTTHAPSTGFQGVPPSDPSPESESPNFGTPTQMASRPPPTVRTRATPSATDGKTQENAVAQVPAEPKAKSPASTRKATGSKRDLGKVSARAFFGTKARKDPKN